MSKYDAPYIANNSLYASGALQSGGFSFIGITVMTANELRMLNLKLDVKTVKALMELYQSRTMARQPYLSFFVWRLPRLTIRKRNWDF